MDIIGVVIALTALAAAGGAVLRHLAGGQLNSDEFPLGTLAVNLAASFLLGVIVSADDPLPTVVGIGALGALSTWSTVANEAAEMARTGRAALGLTYLGLTVSSGVLIAWFGLQLGQLIF